MGQFEIVGESVSHVSVSDSPTDVTINTGAMLHIGEELKLTWLAGTPLPLRFKLDYGDTAGRPRLAHFENTDKAELVALGESEVQTQ